MVWVDNKELKWNNKKWKQNKRSKKNIWGTRKFEPVTPAYVNSLNDKNILINYKNLLKGNNKYNGVIIKSEKVISKDGNVLYEKNLKFNRKNLLIRNRKWWWEVDEVVIPKNEKLILRSFTSDLKNKLDMTIFNTNVFFLLFKDFFCEDSVNYFVFRNLFFYELDINLNLYYDFYYRLLDYVKYNSICLFHFRFFVTKYYFFELWDFKFFINFEFLLKNSDLFRFKSNFFNNKLKQKIKSKFIIYDNFVLRINVYMFFWYGRYIEHLRAVKYNEYVSIVDSLAKKWIIKHSLRPRFCNGKYLIERFKYNLLINRYSIYRIRTKKVDSPISCSNLKILDIFKNFKLILRNIGISKYIYYFFTKYNLFWIFKLRKHLVLYMYCFLHVQWQIFWFFRYYDKLKSGRIYGLDGLYTFIFRPYRFNWHWILLDDFFKKFISNFERNKFYKLNNLFNLQHLFLYNYKIINFVILNYISKQYYSLIKYFNFTRFRVPLRYFLTVWDMFFVFWHFDFMKIFFFKYYNTNSDVLRFYLTKIKYNIDNLIWQVMFAGVIHNKNILFFDYTKYFYYKEAENTFKRYEQFFLDMVFYYFMLFFSNKVLYNLQYRFFYSFIVDYCINLLNNNVYFFNYPMLKYSRYYYRKCLLRTHFAINFRKLLDGHKHRNYDLYGRYVILDNSLSEYPVKRRGYWDLMEF